MKAELIHKSWLKRKFHVIIKDVNYDVEYKGTGLGNEKVYVNGKEASGGTSWLWFIPRFEFKLGENAALITISVWPWLAIKEFRFELDKIVMYEE